MPVIEGSEGGIKDIDEAKELCKKIGFPVLIKASVEVEAKVWKLLIKKENLSHYFSTAKSEAKKYFGNDEVYIEKFFQNPRHIEVQVLAGKIELSIYMREIVQFKDVIKNLLRKLQVQFSMMKSEKIFLIEL